MMFKAVEQLAADDESVSKNCSRSKRAKRVKGGGGTEPPI
jgi:hypothetical protein